MNKQVNIRLQKIQIFLAIGREKRVNGLKNKDQIGKYRNQG
jgi:hypothetical protein